MLLLWKLYNWKKKSQFDAFHLPMLRRRYQRFKSARASCSTMRSEAEILSWGAPAECGSFSVAFDPKCLEALLAAGFTKNAFHLLWKSCNFFFRKFRNIKTTGSQKWGRKHCLFTENARNLIRNFQTVGCWSLYSWMNSYLSREPTTWSLHLLACFTLFSTLNIAVSR